MTKETRGIFVILILLLACPIAARAVDIGAFGDVQLRDSKLSTDRSAFTLGGLDLYATAAIDDKTRVFFELVFENNGKNFTSDLERFSIARAFSDSFQVSAGRFHTPIGYWNPTFHHGALIQDTISRPSFLEFEDDADAILPMHVVGFMVTGKFSTDAGNLGYAAYTGNGPSINTEAGFHPSANLKPEIDVNNVSDPNSSKTVGGRLTFSFRGTPLSVGLFGLNNNVAESAETAGVARLGDSLVRQTVTGADVEIMMHRFSALAEYYHIADKNQVGVPGNYSGTAYYTQLGYKVVDKVKVIYRYESVSLDANDAYFSLLGAREQTHNVYALRYDLSETNAIKFEANDVHPNPGSKYMVYRLQWAFLIP